MQAPQNRGNDWGIDDPLTARHDNINEETWRSNWVRNAGKEKAHDTQKRCCRIKKDEMQKWWGEAHLMPRQYWHRCRGQPLFTQQRFTWGRRSYTEHPTRSWGVDHLTRTTRRSLPGDSQPRKRERNCHRNDNDHARWLYSIPCPRCMDIPVAERRLRCLYPSPF